MKPAIIGVTGPIGSGKTFFCNYLKQNNISVIDCDKVAHEVTLKGSTCLKELVDFFGVDILDSNGELIRSILAKKAFANDQNTKALNRITHKHIINTVMERCEELLSFGKPVCLDAPLLFESGLNEKCDFIIGVIAPLDVRIERISKRNPGWSKEDVQQRIDAQHNVTFFKQNCNIVVSNDENWEDNFKKSLVILCKISYKK